MPDKIKGMTVIKSMIEVKKPGDSSIRTACTDKAAIAKRFEALGLVPAIFGENAHERIIEQSCELLKFLCGHDALSPEGLSTIWRCCTEKHEELSQAGFKLLVGLLPFLSGDVT